MRVDYAKAAPEALLALAVTSRIGCGTIYHCHFGFNKLLSYIRCLILSTQFKISPSFLGDTASMIMLPKLLRNSLEQSSRQCNAVECAFCLIYSPTTLSLLTGQIKVYYMLFNNICIVDRIFCTLSLIFLLFKFIT